MADVTILVEPIESDVTIEVSEVKNGTDGVGLPIGGTTGQVPIKQSATDYDIAWGNVSGGNLINTNYDWRFRCYVGNTNFYNKNYFSNVFTETSYGTSSDIVNSTHFPLPIAYAKGNVEIDKFILILDSTPSSIDGDTFTLSVMKGKITDIGTPIIDSATITLNEIQLLQNKRIYEVDSIDMLDNTMENGDFLFYAIRANVLSSADIAFIQLIPVEK